MITFTLLLGKLHCSEGRGVGCVGISQGHVLLLAGPQLCFSSAGQPFRASEQSSYVYIVRQQVDVGWSPSFTTNYNFEKNFNTSEAQFPYL